MLGPVRYARSIFPPAILVLIVSLDADTVEKNAIVFGYTRVATESRNELFHKYLKFVDEAVAQAADPGSASPTNLKEPPSKADSTTPSKTQAPLAGKTTSSKAPAATKSIVPVDKSQEEKNPPEKSPSILQMLEGHETELMFAAAIAAAFFFIGWICGGNYYLRRDRRRRTKIRF
jgi:hypothetical protein